MQSSEQSPAVKLFEQSRYAAAQPLLAQLALQYLEKSCDELALEHMQKLRAAIHRQKPDQDLGAPIDSLLDLALERQDQVPQLYPIALDVKGAYLRRMRLPLDGARLHAQAYELKSANSFFSNEELATSLILEAKALRVGQQFEEAKDCLRQLIQYHDLSASLELERAVEWGWLYTRPTFSFDSVRKYLQIADQWAAKAYPDSNPLELWPFQELRGTYFLILGATGKAIEAYQQCLHFAREYDLGTAYIIRFLTVLGSNYSRQADIEKALDAYQHLEDQLELIYDDPWNEAYAKLNNSLSATFHEFEIYDRSLYYLRKRVKIFRKIHPPDHPILGQAYTFLAEDFQADGQVDSALIYLHKAEDILGSNKKVDPRDRAYLDWQWGKYHYLTDSPTQSQQYLEKALDYYLQEDIYLFDEKTKVLLDLARLKMSQGDRTAALQSIQEGMQPMVSGFEAQDYQTNPPLTQIYDKRILLRALELKARFLSQSPDKQDRYLASETYSLALQLIDLWRHDLKGKESKLVIARVSRPIYEGSLDLSFALLHDYQDLSQVDSAFTIMEKSKVNLLLELISDDQALRYSRIPDSLVAREADLRMEINFWDEQLWHAQERGLEGAMAKDYRNRLFIVEGELEDLSRSLERDYPDYYRLKYDIQPASLSWVQQALGQDGSLLEYFLGDSSLYLIAINGQEAKMHRIDFSEEEMAKVNQLRETLVQYKTGQDTWQKFTRSARGLYTLLIEPVAHLLGEGSLHIIPDGILHYISFEALLTADPGAETGIYRNLPYFIRRQPILYQYSATLLKETLEEQPSGEEQAPEYVGFAPNFSQQYPALRGAEEGVKSIEGLYSPSTAYIGEAATKENFFKHRGNRQILHLATHATILDKNPMYSHFLFSGSGGQALDSLFTYELYSTRINAALAILEACNTGAGALKRGEGVMSMARGFFYMGVPSVILSLWEIPDGIATPLIIEKLFENLSQGMSKDKALQQAKLHYLDHVKTQSYTHPALWSELVLIGDNAPLPIASKGLGKLTWLALAVLVLALGFWGLRTKRKSSR